jgi:hypothetical protein
VEINSEDFGNMGISNPTLGSNFPKEAIEKIAKLIRMCVNIIGPQPQVPQLTMSDVIDEINGALQLDEGQKAEEGVIKIEIPQYQNKKLCPSFKTPSKDIKW